MIRARYQIVDVFSPRPLEGNPVAVFTDGAGLGGELMQRTARELNLSETVFALPAEDPAADLRVRIFTPAAELPFAGHPVLGAAAAVAADRPGESVRLETGLGVITVRVLRDPGGGVYAEMAHPAPPPEAVPDAPEVLAALGVKRAELPVEAYRNGPRHACVALPSPEAVANLAPDLTALARLGDRRGYSAFAYADGQVKTRMFAPGLGVAEDPATGSAAGPLALHLVRHGWGRRGQQLTIRQGTELGRPSVLYARVEEAGASVVVGGSAVIVAEGTYRLQ